MFLGFVGKENSRMTSFKGFMRWMHILTICLQVGSIHSLNFELQ